MYTFVIMRVIGVILVIFWTSLQSFSQIGDGYLKYHVDLIVVDTSQEIMNAARMLRNSQLEVFFGKDKYRIDSQMGTLFTTSMIHDGKKNRTLMLSSNAKGKYAQEFSQKELKDTSSVEITATVIENRDSTRKILGFKCYYVEMTQNGKVSRYWCTDEINFKFKGASFVDENLPGFPLQIRKEENGLEFTYTASNFQKTFSVTKETFSTDPPAGYTVISPKKN